MGSRAKPILPPGDNPDLTSGVVQEAKDEAKDNAGTTPPNSEAEAGSSVSTAQTSPPTPPSAFEFSANFKDALNEAVNAPKAEFYIPRSTVLTTKQAETVLTEFASTNSILLPQALMIIAILLQTGGSARSCDGNLSVRVFDKDWKVAQLRSILNKHNLKNSERKLARTLAQSIQEICFLHEVPGNLAKKIIRTHPERQYSLFEQTYLSDFQVDNPRCPEILRRQISETFASKKPGPNPGSKTSKQPRRGK